jgi:hypothetical protein
MGDTLELSFLKKEGLQDDLLALDPTVTMRWKECSIGKCSRVSVKHEEDNAFSELGNSLSQSVQAMLCAITGDSGVLTSRLPVRYTTTSAQFVRYIVAKCGVRASCRTETLPHPYNTALRLLLVINLCSV